MPDFTGWSEFSAQLQARAAEALDALRQAVESGDDYSVSVQRGELDSISRIASDHDVPVPALEEYRGTAA